MQKEVLSNALGLDAGAILAHIIAAHPEIDRVFFGEPQLNPALQSRIGLSSSDRQFIERALGQWRDLKLSGWERCLLASEEIPEGILSGAAFHQGISQTRFPVTADGLGAETIRELARQGRPGRILSICSEVLLENGLTMHIPMMDFHCPISGNSLALIYRVVRFFGVGSGVVVETDRSYHFYGFQLLSESKLAPFLGRALLFAPIVDQAWIAHQLIDMCCALRVTAREPGGKVPRVVGVVE
jgi:hypothetical protein